MVCTLKYDWLGMCVLKFGPISVIHFDKRGKWFWLVFLFLLLLLSLWERFKNSFHLLMMIKQLSYYLLLPAWPDIYSQNFKLHLIAKFYFYSYLIDFKIWKYFLVWYYSCLPTAESSQSWVYAGMLRLTSSHFFSNVMKHVGLKSHQRGHRGWL